jgi:hypothetical protein
MFCVPPELHSKESNEKMHPKGPHTGMTSRPIPSAGIKPILSDFLAVVANERKVMTGEANQ